MTAIQGRAADGPGSSGPARLQQVLDELVHGGSVDAGGWFRIGSVTKTFLRDRSRQWTPDEIVEQAVRREPEFPPGTSRAYNNTAFVLLGVLIRQVTGSGYAEQIQRRILRPLDLRRTRADDHDESLPEPHARGYLTVAGKPVDLTACSPSHAGAAGGMISTAADLNRFFAELMTAKTAPGCSRPQTPPTNWPFP